MESTSEAYDYSSVLDYGFDDADAEDDGDNDDPYADELEQEAEETDEAELGLRPAKIEHRPSPVCAFPPAVRAVAERHRAEASDLLNVFTGAVDDECWVDAPFDPWFPSPRPVRQRIYEADLLSDPVEFNAVMAEWRAYHTGIPILIGEFTGAEPRAEFVRAEHHLRDFRFLTALAGLQRNLVHACWYHSRLGQFARSPERKAFLKARDVMRRNDPLEREAARARDTKRRKTKKRSLYLADYRSNPEAKAKHAERERLRRASAKSVNQL